MPRNSAEIGQYRVYHFRYDGGRCDCPHVVHQDMGPEACNCGPRHRYKKDCRYSVPSVTTILKYGVAKEWLGAWAAKMVAELAMRDISEHGDPRLLWANRDLEDHEATAAHQRPGHQCQYAGDPTRWLKGAPWRKRDAAAERGQAVHTAAEFGQAEEDVPENARPRYRQYKNFLALYSPRVLWRELTIYHLGHGYAGSFDLIAEIGDEVLLIDIKTSPEVYHEYRLQQAAYRFGEFIGEDDRRICPVPRVDGAAILHLRDESFQLIRIDAGRREFAAFLAAKTIHDFIKGSEKESIGELVLPQLREGVA